VLGGSFILFYENCWFRFFPTTLERIHSIAEHWVPKFYLYVELELIHMFLKKKEKDGSQKLITG
jgi:hypothetical protein